MAVGALYWFPCEAATKPLVAASQALENHLDNWLTHMSIICDYAPHVKGNLTAANVAARPRLTAHVGADLRRNPIFSALFVQTATRCYMGVR